MWFSFHRLQNCSSSCFCYLPSGGWGYLRGLCKLPDGRDWWWVELTVALVGRAQQNFNPLVCWWVGLGSLPVGCLAWGDPALEPTWLFGGANCGLWEGSCQGGTSQNFCCQCPCPQSEPQPPPSSAGDPPTLVGRFGSVSYGVTAPSPGSRCAHYFVCALQEWSLCFPQSCQKVLQSNTASLQSLIL